MFIIFIRINFSNLFRNFITDEDIDFAINITLESLINSQKFSVARVMRDVCHTYIYFLLYFY